MAFKYPDRKTCPVCGVDKSATEFGLKHTASDGLEYKCRPCYNASRVQAADEWRQRVWTALDNKCACCGETERVFLCIDHKNGGGNIHRKASGGNGKIGYFRSILARLNEFQIMCHNCNYARTRGVCPHQI